MNLTVERLRELVSYDKRTGLFTALVARGPVSVGDALGTVRKDGYVLITVDYRRYLAHRLAHFYVNGAWPVGEVDHRDGDTSNNCWRNLRVGTRSFNQQNQRCAQVKNKSSGLLGVSRMDAKTERYRARIFVDGKERSLGSFSSAEAAHKAYVDAKRRLHEGGTL